jgi:hypothetical protein
MTLVVAWTRITRTGRELWLMSDSRLSGGKFWDYGPKIFGIGRSDGVIAFAGDTAWAYPLIAHISSYIESFINLRERTIDLTEAYDLILKMMNDSLNYISEPADPSLRVPDCSFIFAGYSARRKGYFLRRVVFHPTRRRFEDRPAREFGGESVALIGDSGPVNALARRLSERRRATGRTHARLGVAPAEAFFEVLSSKRFPEIGGAPQLAKVYQHMGQRHFGVYWPAEANSDEQHIYLRGRRLGTFEVLDHPWVYDPSTTSLFWHDFSPESMRTRGEAESAA